MKAVMYHYVRDFDPARPHFRFLNIANFRRQLDHFAQEYGFVSRAEWVEFITTGRMPDQAGKVVLTFDDAMSCHFTHVFPELSSRGLWGIFYVPTRPYVSGRMLDVHRVHLLCGVVDGETLGHHAETLIDDSMVPHGRRADFHKETYRLQGDNAAGITRVKRLLNYFLDERFRGGIIAQLMNDFAVPDPGATFYITPQEIAHMEAHGMLIGAHTVNHPVMSTLSPVEQAREVSECFTCLERFCQPELRSYCHPYGGFHSFDSATLATLTDKQVDFAFNVEARDITIQDHAKARLFLPRYDCNQFPYGAAD